jgi:hypothetical protein
VASRIHQQQRSISKHRVQIGERERKTGRIYLHHLEPAFAVPGVGLEARLDGGLELRNRHQLVVGVALSQI